MTCIEEPCSGLGVACDLLLLLTTVDILSALNFAAAILSLGISFVSSADRSLHG